MENATFGSGAGMAISPAVGMRVLAVDEDPIDLAILTHMLQRYGYQVTAKESPEEGLRALQDNPEGFDIVMTVVRTEGPGIDGFELLRHAANRCPVILFSEVEPTETVNRGIFGGASAFLTKPLRDEKVRDIWRHVAQQREKAAFRAAAIADAARSSDVAARQDDRGTKRRSAGLDDSDEGGSDGSRNQAGTAKKTKLNSPSEAELHAAFVKAAEQLRGTKDYCPRGIRDLLEVQGVQITIEQVTSHLEKYRRGCLTNHQSAMPMASSYHSNISKNYSTPGSSAFYMRPLGAKKINQARLLSNGPSPVGSGILENERYRASHVGLLYNQKNGNLHANANGNCSDQYGNGYDYQYGNGNFNDNASANGYHNGNGRDGVVLDGSMVSASPPSNLAQQVHQAMPQGYGLENGNMVTASLPSNLAQPVQKATHTNSLFPSSMGQQEFPRVSRLWYDGTTGGISMLPMPVPVDDGKELLLSYLQDDNELMQHIASTGMTQGMDEDGADGQISASQPQNLITDPLSSESSNGNGTAGTSGGSGVVTDGNLDREKSVDELEKFLGEDFLLAVTDGNLDRENSVDEMEKFLGEDFLLEGEYIERDNNAAYDELAGSMMCSPLHE